MEDLFSGFCTACRLYHVAKLPADHSRGKLDYWALLSNGTGGNALDEFSGHGNSLLSNSHVLAVLCICKHLRIDLPSKLNTSNARRLISRPL